MKHSVFAKSARIRSFASPYFPAFRVRFSMQENMDQKNSKYGHFSHSMC